MYHRPCLQRVCWGLYHAAATVSLGLISVSAQCEEPVPPQPESEIVETEDDFSQFYRDGLQAFLAGDFAKAESLLVQAVQAQPASAPVRTALRGIVPLWSRGDDRS